MKVIVTGATGMAGREVVKRCISDDRVTKLIILTRKALPKEIQDDPKTEVIMHQDFSSYPDELMQKLDGAEACIWAIGGRVDQFNDDTDLCRRVSVEYTLAFAKSLVSRRRQQQGAPKLRFVFLSGKFAEWDPRKTLLFLGDTRRIKGEVEKGLCELADASEGALQVRILRPSGFVAPDAGVATRVVGSLYSAVSTPQLARVLVTVACEGGKERIIENDALLKM